MAKIYAKSKNWERGITLSAHQAEKIIALKLISAMKEIENLGFDGVQQLYLMIQAMNKVRLFAPNGVLSSRYNSWDGTAKRIRKLTHWEEPCKSKPAKKK